jgi:hypothetical protein
MLSCASLYHVNGPPLAAIIPILSCVQVPPLTSTYETYLHAGPFLSLSVIACPRSARPFTLFVDCILLTAASVTFLMEYTP